MKKPSVDHLLFSIKCNIAKAKKTKYRRRSSFISVYATEDEWELLFDYIDRIKRRVKQ